MRNLFFLVILLLSFGVSAEQSIEVWECKNPAQQSSEPIKIFLGENNKPGSISLSGLGIQIGIVKIQGLDRRLDFGHLGHEKAMPIKYSFIINPNGKGLYYDFTNTEPGEKIIPTTIVDCSQMEIPEEKMELIRKVWSQGEVK